MWDRGFAELQRRGTKGTEPHIETPVCKNLEPTLCMEHYEDGKQMTAGASLERLLHVDHEKPLDYQFPLQNRETNSPCL